VSLTDAPWWQRLTWPVRRLRWRAATWTPATDRAFHDELFGAQDYDPFSPSYPGYLTIRRFADHAERHLDGVRTLVDLGCGPGEITCELARRRPDIRVVGLDHSEAALARARANAARLGLTSVRFEAGDVERYEPGDDVDLVVMFDAFHHVIDPAAFVSRVGMHVSKFFLIEPAGTWLGQWDHRGDLDWMPATIRQIRERLEHQFGLSGPPGAGQHTSDTGHRPAAHAEPTEHRYTPGDIERFFAGYAIDLRGTMAGLELYGPEPHRRSTLGNRFGDISYELVVAIEDALHEADLDLALKHWAILATKSDTPGLTRSRPTGRATPSDGNRAPLLPPYGVIYGGFDGPREVESRESFQALVTLENTGWLPWDSRADKPVMLSYHWLDASGRTVVQDGMRTPFSSTIGPGESTQAVLRVQAPDAAGVFTLAIDLVHEGAAWFSDEGVVPMRRTVHVRA